MRTAYKASLILAFCLALFYVFQALYPDFTFPPYISGAAFISYILALKRYSGSFKERFSWVWFNFSGTMGFWFLAEVAWAVYTLFLNVKISYPSIADFLWASGYMLLFLAFHSHIKEL